MVPSLEMIALSLTTPEMRACLASGGYTGRGWRTSLADWTLPPTLMRWGVTGLASSFLGGGGGGGGAAEGTEPIMPPSTPPGAPPATPPGTPPTTPATPDDGGGSSSSLICATSLGTTFGAISLPASNCRGMTFTPFTGAAAAGGGGGGGGGGGATRKLLNVAAGRTSNQIIGMIATPAIRTIWITNAIITVAGFFVWPSPTNVCSNMKAFLS